MKKFNSPTVFWDFYKDIRTNLRYIRTPEGEEFLRAVAETSRLRTRRLKQGCFLWRAQLGFRWHKETIVKEGDPVVFPTRSAYPPDRMKPRAEQAYEGRANPKGIPCLYLADSKETATYEVRPRIGSYVTIGRFRVCRDIEVVDCSKNYGEPPVFIQDDIDSFMLSRSIMVFNADPASGDSGKREEPDCSQNEHAVWRNIDDAFARPVTRSDDDDDYAITQIIAEVIKSQGYDGITYRSSCRRGGKNYALFRLDLADIVDRLLYTIEEIDIKIKGVDEL